MIAAACWAGRAAQPLLWTAHTLAGAAGDSARSPGVFGAYRQLWRDLSSEWRRDRNFVYYLLVSAVFRDGLSGIFSFAGVLGVSVYGISQGDVLIFGVAGSTVAACGALLGGRLDDRIGAKPVIVTSLSALLVVGIALLALSGPVTFWIWGLGLALLVGPTQSSARTLLLRDDR